MTSLQIREFRFEAQAQAIADLQHRLRNTIWPDEAVAEPWRYGPPVAYMRELVDYWLHEYDWRTHEARLNAFPQFETVIGKHRIHFIHQIGKGRAPIP